MLRKVVSMHTVFRTMMFSLVLACGPVGHSGTLFREGVRETPSVEREMVVVPGGPFWQGIDVAELDDVEKSDARYIFLRLVDVVWRDQSMSAVPQRVPRHLFHTRLTPLIDKLTQSELLIARQEGITGMMSGSVKTMLGGKATLEIAHEIILSAWPKLKGWIQERQKALFMHGRVAERTASWLDAREHDALHASDELLTGRELALASDMRARGDFAITVEGKVADGLSEAENRFLDASLERRAERRMRHYINFMTRLAVIGVGLVVTLGLLDVWLRFGLLRLICK